jgi:hypothetical protein
MASETIKALLMIALFCSLQAALHLSRLLNSPKLKLLRRAMILRRPHLPARAPTSYALIPVSIRRSRRVNYSDWRRAGWSHCPDDRPIRAADAWKR